MDSISQYQQHVKLAQYQPLRDNVLAARLNKTTILLTLFFRMTKHING